MVEMVPMLLNISHELRASTGKDRNFRGAGSQDGRARQSSASLVPGRRRAEARSRPAIKSPTAESDQHHEQVPAQDQQGRLEVMADRTTQEVLGHIQAQQGPGP